MFSSLARKTAGSYYVGESATLPHSRRPTPLRPPRATADTAHSMFSVFRVVQESFSCPQLSLCYRAWAPLWGVSICRLSGVGALWDCIPRVCCGGVAVPAAVYRWGLSPRCPGVGRSFSWSKHSMMCFLGAAELARSKDGGLHPRLA